MAPTAVGPHLGGEFFSGGLKEVGHGIRTGGEGVAGVVVAPTAFGGLGGAMFGAASSSWSRTPAFRRFTQGSEPAAG